MDKANPTILIKLSGEALSGGTNHPLDPDTLLKVAQQIAAVSMRGYCIGIVIGAGNIWRGNMDMDLNRPIADDMGMVATLINCLAMKDAIMQTGVRAEVLSAVPVKKFADDYTPRHAKRLLDHGYVVIFACGTGNPFVTTDTAGALRACEIGADRYVQARNVDAVYDSNPDDNPHARRFRRVSYTYLIEKGLQILEPTAALLCSDNNIDSILFSLHKENAIMDACECCNCGTIISNDGTIKYYETTP